MLTIKNLLPWQTMIMNIGAVGTAVVFAKFIFLPHHNQDQQQQPANLPPNFWLALILLLGGLMVANLLYYQAYTVANITKALLTIGLGWLTYDLIIFNRLIVSLVVARRGPIWYSRAPALLLSQ